MILRGIEFGNVLCASGVQGFFGEGYWFHQLWHPFGLDLDRATFVSKTATLFPNKGNMPLTYNFGPKEFFPASVKVKLRRGLVINAIGLSNPSLNTLLKIGLWQKRRQPFMISAAPIASTPRSRLEEIKQIIDIIGFHKDSFSCFFGLQINLSCPNINHDPKKLIDETFKILDAAGILKIPLIPKYSIASAPINAILELNNCPNCDAICVSNSIPFGWPGIDWNKIYGNRVSPLVNFGGGGLSGKELRPLVCRWIRDLREAGFTKPINGGGGILQIADVDHYHSAGASSIFLGSVAILRPWRVRGIIKYANKLKWN